jgi:hypothetical protein
MKKNSFTNIYKQSEYSEDSEDTILFSGNRDQEIAVISQSLYSKLLTITLFPTSYKSKFKENSHVLHSR